MINDKKKGEAGLPKITSFLETYKKAIEWVAFLCYYQFMNDNEPISSKAVLLDQYIHKSWGLASKGKVFKKYRNRMMKASTERVSIVNGNN